MSSFAVILSKLFKKNSKSDSYDSYIIQQFTSKKKHSDNSYVTHKFNKLKYSVGEIPLIFGLKIVILFQVLQ